MRLCQTYLIIITTLLFLLMCIFPSFGEDAGISGNHTSNDTEFLFMMNQYWIPDLYEIKGRIDGSVTYDIPDVLNLSVEYANIRLKKNLNETSSYNISPDLSYLRSAYNRTVQTELTHLNRIPYFNRSDPQFPVQVSGMTARLSLYGAWLEYQVMQRYAVPNRTFPALATVPADEFFAIMSNMT